MKILIVDDSRMARNNITKVLSGLVNITVFEAEDGNDAWDIIQKESPDIIFTDWYMENMDGIELICKVRATGSPVKICMLTSETNRERQSLAMSQGADYILTKPLKLEELARALEHLIG